MLHIMFPDLTAHHVSFPKHTQPQKKAQRRAEARASFSFLKWEDGENTRASSVRDTY